MATNCHNTSFPSKIGRGRDGKKIAYTAYAFDTCDRILSKKIEICEKTVYRMRFKIMNGLLEI